MKKLYLEPEIEIYKFTIIDSILYNSDETPVGDKEVGGGEDPGNDDDL